MTISDIMHTLKYSSLDCTPSNFVLKHFVFSMIKHDALGWCELYCKRQCTNCVRTLENSQQQTIKRYKETVDQLLRTKVRRKLLNQDKPSRLASYALPQHKPKSARLAASEFCFLLAVLRRSRWVRAVEQA